MYNPYQCGRRVNAGNVGAPHRAENKRCMELTKLGQHVVHKLNATRGLESNKVINHLHLKYHSLIRKCVKQIKFK